MLICQRSKYGVKLYFLSEPNGFTLKLAIYIGKDSPQGGKNCTMKIGFHLQEKLGRCHSVFIDNFYNSVSTYL